MMNEKDKVILSPEELEAASGGINYPAMTKDEQAEYRRLYNNWKQADHDRILEKISKEEYDQARKEWIKFAEKMEFKYGV